MFVHLCLFGSDNEGHSCCITQNFVSSWLPPVCRVCPSSCYCQKVPWPCTYVPCVYRPWRHSLWESVAQLLTSTERHSVSSTFWSSCSKCDRWNCPSAKFCTTPLEVCGHSHVAPSLPRLKSPRCPVNGKFDGYQTAVCLSSPTRESKYASFLHSPEPKPYTERSSFCIITIALYLLISDTTSDRPHWGSLPFSLII